MRGGVPEQRHDPRGSTWQPCRFAGESQPLCAVTVCPSSMGGRVDGAKSGSLSRRTNATGLHFYGDSEVLEAERSAGCQGGGERGSRRRVQCPRTLPSPQPPACRLPRCVELAWARLINAATSGVAPCVRPRSLGTRSFGFSAKTWFLRAVLGPKQNSEEGVGSSQVRAPPDPAHSLPRPHRPAPGCCTRGSR